MSGTESLVDFAYRVRSNHPALFGPKRNVETVREGLVQAASAEDAVRQVASKCSVLALDYGVSIEVARVSWGRATRRRARYTAAAMLGYGLVNPVAKLVIERA